MKFRDLILAIAAAAMLFMFLCLNGCKTCKPWAECTNEEKLAWELSHPEPNEMIN